MRDAAARELIETCLDRNVLVEASAGSGKTESMARRMTRGILTGEYRVEGMAAVTFTRKAASELRGRFQLALERSLDAAEGPQKERAELALAGLERLFAGTIHSFCARLLRSHPVEAGISPGFRELEESENDELALECWRRHLDRLRSEGSPLLTRLSACRIDPSRLAGAYRTVCMYYDVDFPAVPVSEPPPVWDEVLDFRRRLKRLMPWPPPRDRTCAVLRSALRFLQVCRRGELAEAVACFESEPRFVKKSWKLAKEQQAELETLVSRFRQEVALPYLRQWRAWCYPPVIELLLGARAEFERYRLERALLNFDDLLYRAARLLRTNQSVRASLQGRFRWLFVDEFQDTDPVQAEVLFWLAAQDQPANWAESTPRPGSLFIVGDPKQSIYRFRRADIDTYLRVRERIEATGGLVLGLTTSFRSVPAVCDWVNQVFSSAFPEEPTPHQAPGQQLEPYRNESGGVFTLSLQGSNKTVHLAEARRLGRFMAGEVAAGRRGWGDFLLLTRQRKHLAAIAGALIDLGLPVECTGGDELSHSSWVRALLELLHCLCDPQDRVGQVGVLRGPFFGLSDPELYRHFALGEPGPVGEALAELARMRQWVRELPAGAAVERILEHTTVLAQDPQEAAHLLAVASRLAGKPCLGSAVSELREALDEPERLASTPLEAGRREVVRLMNLHQAKGLEGTVVFLIDCEQPAREWVTLRVQRDGSRAVGFLPVREGWWARLAQPLDWDDHEAQELQYARAEETRLLYVAATRAREQLVVCRYVAGTSPSRGPWTFFEPWLDQVPELEVPDQAPRPAARPRLALESEDPLAGLREPGWRRVAVAAAQRTGELAFADLTGPGGVEWGTLVHGLLEAAMAGTATSAEELERLAGWLTFEQEELRELIPAALDTVRQVMATDFWREASAARTQLVEVPFGFSPESGTAVFGTLDLVLEKEAGWEVVDYKTDRRRLDDIVEHYAGQVLEYARSWANITGQAVTYAGLYGVREGRLSRDVRSAER